MWLGLLLLLAAHPLAAQHIIYTKEATPTMTEYAQMCYDAYYSYNNSHFEWIPNHDLIPIGWENQSIRGYVFVSDTEANVVFKGTSLEFIGIGQDTSAQDKTADNLLFSYCCGQLWPLTPVCHCETCATTSPCFQDYVLNQSVNYYLQGLDIYHQMKAQLPTKRFKLLGHSLGGGLATILGAKLVLPVVTFGCPGTQHFLDLMGIVLHNEHEHIHIGNTQDPIFKGTCGWWCYIAGYVIQTRCRRGIECIIQSGDGNSLLKHVITEYLEDVKKADTWSCSLVTTCVE